MRGVLHKFSLEMRTGSCFKEPIRKIISAHNVTSRGTAWIKQIWKDLAGKNWQMMGREERRGLMTSLLFTARRRCLLPISSCLSCLCWRSMLASSSQKTLSSTSSVTNRNRYLWSFCHALSNQNTDSYLPKSWRNSTWNQMMDSFCQRSRCLLGRRQVTWLKPLTRTTKLSQLWEMRHQLLRLPVYTICRKDCL